MKKQSAILFFEENTMQVVVNGKTFEQRIPRDVFARGEVVQKELFEQLVLETLQKHTISHVLVILGNELTYQSHVTLEADVVEKSEFFDMVPYEQITTKTIPFKNKQLLLATNADLCEALEEITTANHIVLHGILSQPLLKELFPTLKPTDSQLLKKLPQLQQYSFVHIQEQKDKVTLELPNILAPRFLIMVAILVVLVAVLLTMLFVLHTTK